jgi:hypothetical protein
MLFAHLKRILRFGRLRLRGPRLPVRTRAAQNLRRLGKFVARPPPRLPRALVSVLRLRGGVGIRAPQPSFRLARTVTRGAPTFTRPLRLLPGQTLPHISRFAFAQSLHRLRPTRGRFDGMGGWEARGGDGRSASMAVSTNSEPSFILTSGPQGRRQAVGCNPHASLILYRTVLQSSDASEPHAPLKGIAGRGRPPSPSVALPNPPKVHVQNLWTGDS